MSVVCELQHSVSAVTKRTFVKGHTKVTYPKYSKHWLSTVAHTIDWVCSKILNHGLIHGLLFSLFKFFWWKNILNWLENSGLKSRFLFCLIFQFYLMYRLICQKPAHFLSAQMALVSTFFQMFILLGMYNFGSYRKTLTQAFDISKRVKGRFSFSVVHFCEIMIEFLRI